MWKHWMESFDWNAFDSCRQQLSNGEAHAALGQLRELRQRHAEPAIATVMADALGMLGRPEEAVGVLEADITQGIDNHWTHYTLGHHHAAAGNFAAASTAFNRCHDLLDWPQSLQRGYTFTHDYFSGHIPQWREWFAGPIDRNPIEILEIGSWQGGSTLWLLDHVLAVRGGHLTCVDTWEGSSEHTFLASLQLSIEELFDLNVSLTGLQEKVSKIRGASQEVLPGLQPASYDLIYIDGAHESRYVIQDAIQAHRLVRPGGFLLFDDYHYSFPDSSQDTRRAIDFFISCFASQYEVIGKNSQVLIRRKPT
jgi:SAM-dependent methyltransferase